MWRLKWFSRYDAADAKLKHAVQQIIGASPNNLELYKLALRHSSTQQNSQIESSSSFGKNHNERLEYLGDAILGAIIAEYLFKKFPFKDEGFLTEIRSRLVNRESLTQLAMKIGVNNILEANIKQKVIHPHRSMHGDALEALIGAVYLDKGFDFSKRFIIQNLFETHIKIDDVIANETNHKSKIIEWAQKENKDLKFEIVDSKGKDHMREFTAQIIIDGEIKGVGRGLSKKKAEQAAAAIVITSLEIK